MRKVIEVNGPEGRDKVRLYVLTEWPARKAARWGVRATVAVCRAGATLAPDIKPGMGSLAQIGGIGSMLMYIDSNEIVGLLDELLECVRVKPDPQKEFVRELLDDDIEEVATVLYLQQEVFALHTGFTLAELKSKLTSALREKLSSIIPMFQRKSEPSLASINPSSQPSTPP